jgi:hypothetical protein
MVDAKLSAKASEQLGLPPGFRTYSPFPFGGMNVQSSPVALADNEFLYVENFVRLGDGNMRTVWDKGAAIFTAPSNLTIVWSIFFNIGTSYYCAVFLSDGSAIQVDMVTLAQTVMGAARTFYTNTGQLPYARQWGTQYLIISNRNTPNDYWIWDGAILYKAGTVAPGGVNILSGGYGYISTPAITVYGGHGSGLALSAVVSGGSIAELNIVNPGSGYQVGDQVRLGFSGGGSDTSAILTAFLNPSGVGGAVVTAPGSGYTIASALFTGGGGTGAAATVTISTGVSQVNMLANGSGYSTATVTFSGGGGTGAAGTAHIVGGAIASIIVTSSGSNYTSAPTVIITGNGSGAFATALIANGVVSAIQITASGANYTSAPTLTITGTGSGALGVVELYPSPVASVSVTVAGSGFRAVPLLTIVGGGGSGATATAALSGSTIASITVTAGGQYYTDAPTVLVSPGQNNSAYATVTLMPYGVSGSVLETYLSRVWIFNPAAGPTSILPPGGNWQVSAPGSFTDFATSDGGVFAVNTDAFLDQQYTQVRQSSGYLYAIGNGSVSVISNVNTSGSPTSTTYNYQNVDPQAGCRWRDTLQDFSRSTIFANETGVYGLYGGAATKISAKLDQLFTNAVFPPAAGAITPSSAVATIFSVKHYLMLMTIADPDTGALRNVMITWNEKDWVITSQTVSLQFIATKRNGSLFYAYGTDGSSIYPMFNAPSTTLQKRMDTKIYGADKMFMEKSLQGVWIQAQDNSVAGSGIIGTLSAALSGIGGATSNGVPFPINDFSQTVPSGVSQPFVNQVALSSPYPYWNVWGTGVEGNGFMSMGIRFTSLSPDFTMANLVIGYTDQVAFFA